MILSEDQWKDLHDGKEIPLNDFALAKFKGNYLDDRPKYFMGFKDPNTGRIEHIKEFRSISLFKECLNRV